MAANKAKDKGKIQAKRHSGPPIGAARECEIRGSIYAWTLANLEQLCIVTNTKMAFLASQMVETCVQLWHDNPWDAELYLKRCEDPKEAHVSISPERDGPPYLADFGGSESRDLRMFYVAAHRCLQHTNPTDLAKRIFEVQREVENGQD